MIWFDVPTNCSQRDILALFSNCQRIKSVEFIHGDPVLSILNNYSPIKGHYFEKPIIQTNRAVLIHFFSNSAARKTLDTVIDRQNVQLYWVNDYG
mmetsp:Transcript_41145/g.36471  ORF Transcript_41145/g.36471 Transcript_41145/m.36471 type:complete len:95 (-) Transcript_41145:884-1168(-)